MKLKVEPTSKLEGTIKISGSKNATLPLMVCSMLTNEKIILENVPNITDVMVMKELLEDVGIKCNYYQNTMILQKNKIKKIKNLENVKKIRASIYVIAGLITCKKNFKTIYPGGCSFTERPINYHLDVFKKQGYLIKKKENFLIFKKRFKRNKDQIFNLEKKSVGTTINILFVSVLKKRTTIIYNPSLEPEVLEVIKMLNLMKAYIKIENHKIIIKGVKKLYHAKIQIMSDRIEAGSYMLLATAVQNSNVLIKNIDVKYLTAVIKIIKQLGAYVQIYDNSIRIMKKYPLKGIKVTIDDYPNFPTDLQQILCVACTKALTPSTIKDLIYPERLTHVKELQKCHANVKVKENVIYIAYSNLLQTSLYAHDLRCGFACIVMAVLMDNPTIINHSEAILRGYETLIFKLRQIGIITTILDYDE